MGPRRVVKRRSWWAALAVGALVSSLVAVGGGAGASTTTNEGAPSFVRFLGTRGAAAPFGGDLLRPSDLAVAPSGDVYVTDLEANRVLRYSATGAFLGSWGGTAPGSGPGDFNHPKAVAVTANGDVYVVDQENHRVQRFTATGQFLSTWGTQGGGDGRFFRPLAIAVAPDGNLWVTDSACRIQQFTPTGAFVSGWGTCFDGTNQVRVPDGIAVASDGTLYLASLALHRVFHTTADGTTLLGYVGGINATTADGDFVQPADVDVAPDGSLYVTDSGHDRIQRFDGAGTFQSKWGTRGTGNGEFTGLAGLAVSAGGDVYTAEVDPPSRYPDPDPPHRVQRFTANGTFLAGWGAYGDGQGRFWGPKDVAAAPDGGLVVADTRNQRIVRSTGDLVFDTSWGAYGSAPGSFIDPEAVAVAPGGDVYVADTGNNRVQRFTADGTFVSQWGTLGAGDGQFNGPAGIAVDPSGDVWVGDRGNDRVERFSAGGGFEASFGGTGTGPRQFESPSAVAVSAEGVFVADTGNNRVQRLGLDGSFGSLWPTDDLYPPVGLATDPHGGVWVDGLRFDAGNRIWRFTRSGVRLATFATNDLVRGRGLDVGPGGHLFVSDEYDFSDHLVELAPTPGALVAVTLSAAPYAEVGRRIDFSTVIRNTGSAPLTGLQASYSSTPECDGPVPDIPVGATRSVTCSHLAVAADVGTLANQVSITSDQIPAAVQSPAGAASVVVTYPSPRQLAQLGGPGTGPGQLQSPTDLAVDANGDVFVTNQQSTGTREVDVYHAGQPDRAFPVAITATGVTIGSDGSLFLLGRAGNDVDVVHYAASGTSLGTVPGGSRDGVGTGIASRADGHLLLATLGYTQLVCSGFHCENQNFGSSSVFDLDPGTGLAGSITPGGVEVASGGGLSYTLTTGGSSTVVGSSVLVRSGGSTVRTIALGGNASDLDVDATGNLFVAFPDTDEVKVLSPTGQVVARWSTPADRVALGPHDKVYVLDQAASLVRVFGFGITGMVQDEVSDAPIPGAVAIAVDAVGHVAGAAVADAAGNYRIAVGPGQYRVAFLDPSGAHQGEWAWGHALSDPTAAAAVMVGATGATVNIGLDAARGSLAGTVVADGSASPVPGAWVVAVGQGTGAVRGTVAGDDGAYSLGGVDPGGHVVAFVDPSGQRRFEFFEDRAFAPFADPVTVSAGTVSTANAGLPAQGPFSSGATIAGTVTDDDAGGVALAGAWVVAVRADGVMRAGAVTDGSGRYSLSVGPGNYRVQVIDPAGRHTGQWVPDRALDDFEGAQVVALGPGGTATVDAGLSSNRGSISGTVTDPSGPTAGALVLAISTSTGQVAGAATASGNGTYAVTGLWPGSYLVAFVDPTGGHGFEYFDDATSPAAAMSVAVTASHAVTVDAELP